MMNEEGEVDMIRGRPMIDNFLGESPASLVPTPRLIISKELKEILEREKLKKKQDEDWKGSFLVDGNIL